MSSTTTKHYKPSSSPQNTIPPVQTTTSRKYIPLRRTLRLDQTNPTILKQINVKRLHLRKILEETNLRGHTSYELQKLRHLKPQILKSLTHLHISCFARYYWLQNLKNSKKLQEVKTDPNDKSKVSIIIQYLKHIPPTIKSIGLSILEGLTPKDICTIYKLLRVQCSLKSYQQFFLLANEAFKKNTEEEFSLIRKHVPRLTNLKEFEYQQNISDQLGFQAVLKKDDQYPWITKLKVYIGGAEFPVYEEIEDFMEVEKSEERSEDDEEDGEEGEEGSDDEPLAAAFNGPRDNSVYDFYFNGGDESDDSDFNADEESLKSELEEDLRILDQANIGKRDKSKRREEAEEEENEEEEEDDAPEEISEEEKEAVRLMQIEIKPFYNFAIFPNLKDLTFKLGEDCLYRLDSFVADGFEGLKNLEKLRITVPRRPIGITYFFDGFLKLNQLKTFELSLPFMEDEEYDLLDQFFQKQLELVSLHISIPQRRSSNNGFTHQNEKIVSMMKAINNMKKLRYLNLEQIFCSVEAISKGFAQLTDIPNQLQSVWFSGIDDTVLSKSDALERSKGLCDFLKSQKESLNCVTVEIPFVSDVDLVNNIFGVIGELKELKELNIYVNCHLYVVWKEFMEYFEETLQEEVAKKEKRKVFCSKEWDPSVGKMLKGLDKLYDLSVNFGKWKSIDKQSVKWFEDMLKVLPKMEALRELEIRIPSGKFLKQAGNSLEKAFEKLENVTSVEVNMTGLSNVDKSALDVEEIVDKFNSRQSLKTRLMF